MAQATDTRTTSRDRVTPVAAFSLSHKFEELAVFWHFHNGMPFRAALVDGEFEIAFDAEGDWSISDLWISADNGRLGSEAEGRIFPLNAKTDERFFGLVVDAIHAQYTTRIEEWIADELTEAGGRRAA
jgi:hypothetical protein